MYDGWSKKIATTRATSAGLTRRQCGRGVRSRCHRSGGCLSGVSLGFADSLSNGISSRAVVVASIF